MRDNAKRERKPTCAECGAMLLPGRDWPWNYTKTGKRVCNRCRDGANKGIERSKDAQTE